MKGSAQGRTERLWQHRADPAGALGLRAAGGWGRSAALGSRAGRQVSRAASRCPRWARSPPPAAGRQRGPRRAPARAAVTAVALRARGAAAAARGVRGALGSIRQAIIQQTAPSGDLAGASICNYPAKYRVNLVLERGPLQPGTSPGSTCAAAPAPAAHRAPLTPAAPRRTHSPAPPSSATSAPPHSVEKGEKNKFKKN